MTGRMKICVAALLATAILTPPAQADEAAVCPLQAGAVRVVLQQDRAAFGIGREARRGRVMSQQVLSLVARNIGHFDVEMNVDGPFAGATEQHQIELMTAIAEELGLRQAGEEDTPAAGR